MAFELSALPRPALSVSELAETPVPENVTEWLNGRTLAGEAAAQQQRFERETSLAAVVERWRERFDDQRADARRTLANMDHPLSFAAQIADLSAWRKDFEEALRRPPVELAALVTNANPLERFQADLQSFVDLLPDEAKVPVRVAPSLRAVRDAGTAQKQAVSDWRDAVANLQANPTCPMAMARVKKAHASLMTWPGKFCEVYGEFVALLDAHHESRRELKQHGPKSEVPHEIVAAVFYAIAGAVRMKRVSEIYDEPQGKLMYSPALWADAIMGAGMTELKEDTVATYVKRVVEGLRLARFEGAAPKGVSRTKAINSIAGFIAEAQKYPDNKQPELPRAFEPLKDLLQAA